MILSGTLEYCTCCAIVLVPKTFSLFYLFGFWATPGNAQGSFLALHSGIPLGGAQATVRGAQNRTQLGPVHGKGPASWAVSPVHKKILF